MPVDPAGIGTALAAVIAAVTGVVAFVATRRTTKHTEATDAALKVTTATADLNRAEVAGWKTLIETLMGQYTEATREAGVMRGELIAWERKYAELERELAAAHVRIAALEAAVGGRRASDPDNA